MNNETLDDSNNVNQDNPWDILRAGSPDDTSQDVSWDTLAGEESKSDSLDKYREMPFYKELADSNNPDAESEAQAQFLLDVKNHIELSNNPERGEEYNEWMQKLLLTPDGDLRDLGYINAVLSHGEDIRPRNLLTLGLDRYGVSFAEPKYFNKYADYLAKSEGLKDGGPYAYQQLANIFRLGDDGNGDRLDLVGTACSNLVKLAQENENLRLDEEEQRAFLHFCVTTAGKIARAGGKPPEIAIDVDEDEVNNGSNDFLVGIIANPGINKGAPEEHRDIVSKAGQRVIANLGSERSYLKGLRGSEFDDVADEEIVALDNLIARGENGFFQRNAIWYDDISGLADEGSPIREFLRRTGDAPMMPEAKVAERALAEHERFMQMFKEKFEGEIGPQLQAFADENWNGASVEDRKKAVQELVAAAKRFYGIAAPVDIFYHGGDELSKGAGTLADAYASNHWQLASKEDVGQEGTLEHKIAQKIGENNVPEWIQSQEVHLNAAQLEADGVGAALANSIVHELFHNKQHELALLYMCGYYNPNETSEDSSEMPVTEMPNLAQFYAYNLQEGGYHTEDSLSGVDSNYRNQIVEKDAWSLGGIAEEYVRSLMETSPQQAS